ncbi:MSMEG_0568 family radical SAM protein [Jatrophihabitans sp. YIM 134969]
MTTPPAAAGASDLQLRAELATSGVRVHAPVRRTGGAGPTDDGHVVLMGLPTTLRRTEDSRFTLDGSRLIADGVVVEDIEVSAVRRPAFYDLETSDGVAMDKIARLHGRDVLATTTIQTCTRYGPEATRCRFCAVEMSLESGATTAVKTPAQLAEVAARAVELDGVRSMVMTTGTTPGSDRGAAHLERCVRAVLAAVPGLPIQVQCEPPGDLSWIGRLKAAGATAIGIHVEALDVDVRRRWTPGKATVPMSEYEAAWDEAVRVFGRNRVSTYLLVGLGEDPDELVAGCASLIDRGVYPFVVPFRPHAGALAVDVDGASAPDPGLVLSVTTRVAALLQAAGMRGADQGAGCASCGACGLLSAAGG